MRTDRLLCRFVGIWISLVMALILYSRSSGRAEETPGVRRIVLSNGMRLLLKPETTTDVVAISLFIRMPRDTTPMEQAIGELVSHALWYGSTDRSMETTAYSVAQVGGVLETLRTPDYIVATCVTVPDQVDEAAHTLCEALKHADFTPEALARARRDILDEQQKRAANGFTATTSSLGAALGKSEDAPEVLLRHVSQAQALAYFQERYVPAQTVVSVVGNFTPGAVQTDFEAYADDFDRTSRLRPTLDPAEEPGTGQQAVKEISISGTAAYAMVGISAPRVDSPDYPAFTVLQALLGSGHASRLFRNLRDQLGIGYDIGASYPVDRSGPLIAYLEWDPRRTVAGSAGSILKPADALKRLEEQLDSILASPPDEAEITRARNVAIGHDALRHERARDRAFLLGWYETMGLGYGFDADLPRRLNEITREDLLQVARKYLSHRAAVIALPQSETPAAAH